MRRRSAILGLAAVIGLLACSPKPEASNGATASQPSSDGNPLNADAPIVVMLGDSLTAGYNLPPGSALPAAVQRQFDANGVVAKVVNAGVSGDTTADGLNRYDFSVGGSHAAMLVVALGANDFLNDLPADQAKKNLAAILDHARKDQIATALLGITIPEGAQHHSMEESAYAKLYPDLAKEYDIPLYPNMLAAIAGKPELLQEDGLHPTAAGVEEMSVGIAAFLAPLVKDLP